MGIFEIAVDKFEGFVGVNLWTMIFAWCNLLILYLVMKKFLFKPIKNMIDSRQKEIDDMYSDAETAKIGAEELRSEYEEKISRAKDESEEILKSAQRRALLKEEEILREADEKAARTLERAEEQIELERARAINDVKDEVSHLAIDIASAVIERDVSASEHSDMRDEFINSIGTDK